MKLRLDRVSVRGLLLGGLVVATALLIDLSLDLDHYRVKVVYRATLAPAENNRGIVSLVFAGRSFDTYVDSYSLLVPERGWTIERKGDTTTLTAHPGAEPLRIRTRDAPVRLMVRHFPAAGTLSLGDATGGRRDITLYADRETHSEITVGGSTSDVPGLETPAYSAGVRAAVFAAILTLLALITVVQVRRAGQAASRRSARMALLRTRPSQLELFGFALPLLASTLVVWLGFWPANTAFDASMQWVEAVRPGQLTPTLGVSTTLFMRLFAHLSPSPAMLIAAQAAMAALGVALILRELRYRGVARWTALTVSLVLALLPQYATFFTNLGKDALGAVGILWLAYGLLALSRRVGQGVSIHGAILVIAAGAAFTGMMRINTLPPVMIIVLLTGLYLRTMRRRRAAMAAVGLFAVLVIAVPKLALELSAEHRAQGDSAAPHNPIAVSGFSIHYLYHLFGAAVHSGLPLDPVDTAPFYQIAPEDAWADYDCTMTDSTMIAVSKAIRLEQRDYGVFLATHKADMAAALGRILSRHPSILWERQRCITRLLWATDYGRKPFQVNATLGYDGVTPAYLAIAGPNRSLLPDRVRTSLQGYLAWSEDQARFWVFWKPAWISLLGLFCGQLYGTLRRDAGVVLVCLLALGTTLTLALLIPFPAYRYQFPVALILALLVTLASAKPTGRIEPITQTRARKNPDTPAPAPPPGTPAAASPGHAGDHCS